MGWQYIQKLGIVLVLVTLLVSGTCRYLPRIQFWAFSDVSPAVNLYLASRMGDSEAKSKLFEYAVARDEQHWISLLAEAEDPKSQFQLALHHTDHSLRRFWLKQAVSQNYPPALYEYGQINVDETVKLNALNNAAEQGFKPAQRALYHWHWLHEEYEMALPWLRQLAASDDSSALLLARYLWKTEKHSEAIEWFEHAEDLGNTNATTYLQLVTEYWRKHNKPRVAETINFQQCNINMQFIATSIESAKQAMFIENEFQNDERLTGLGICTNDLVWMDSSKLPCNEQAINNYRITCDLSRVPDHFSPDQFSHLVIFTDKGKANVNNGVMYLDLTDTYSVFVHELAHFAGFMDEYPIADAMAERFCHVSHQHPNIIVAEPDRNDLSQMDLSYWQDKTDGISLVKSRTCNNHINQAYKISSKMTFMEFHDSQIIPQSYLNIWKHRLQSREGVVPAHINIAQALEYTGQNELAREWWGHYRAFSRNLQE